MVLNDGSENMEFWNFPMILDYGTVMPSEPIMPFGQKGDILANISSNGCDAVGYGIKSAFIMRSFRLYFFLEDIAVIFM